MLKKTPIGIEPRNIWEKKRIKELKSAIKRYVDDERIKCIFRILRCEFDRLLLV